MRSFHSTITKISESLIPFILVCLLVTGCTTNDEKSEEKQDELSLEGTWELLMYIDHQGGGTEWVEYDENIIYLKHITATHFTWASYDKSTQTLNGTGGGTYTFDGKEYIEDIEFFYPAGSSELGQAIPFTVGMEDGQWFHTGYVKVMEFDAEKGENIVSDSSKIEEIWGRVEDLGNELELVGTWELVSVKNPGDSIWTEYPDFVGYLKHITPTHFNWIYFNTEGDEVSGEGGGIYKLKGNDYIEYIQYSYNTIHNIVNTEARFSYRIEGDKWYHNGYVKDLKLDPESGEYIVADSSKIEEIWQRYSAKEIL